MTNNKIQVEIGYHNKVTINFYKQYQNLSNFRKKSTSKNKLNKSSIIMTLNTVK